ncbi:MAG: RAD55 family ATPase, partial [Candidatus Ranarchaeia archaeon]
MDLQTDLPQVLIDFLKKPRGILVIKGNPGSGKTILGLELMKYFAKEHNALYVSTRVSSLDLIVQCPWVTSFLEGLQFVGTSESKIPEGGKSTFFDLTHSDLPDFIRKIFNEINKVENPFLIFDSWDAIAGKLDLEKKLEAEERLINNIKQLNGKAIFISETPELQQIDYLADGVLTLKFTNINNSKYRKVQIHKLRGINIPHKEILYTLANGRFNALRALDPIDSVNKFELIK